MAADERLIPGETENLSSTYHQKGDARDLDGKLGNDVDQADGGVEPAPQRGQRAGFDPKSGAVSGSGANAGGGGVPGEDHDGDAQSTERLGRTPASSREEGA